MRLGLGPGDRIAIVLPNGPEMALVAAGGHVGRLRGAAEPEVPRGRVPLLPRRPPRRGAGDGRRRAGRAARARRAGDDDRRTRRARRLRSTSSSSAPRSSHDAAAAADADRPDRRPTIEALVLHTSGTTSRPKIVPLRQRNLAASARNIAASLAADRGRPLADRHAAVPHPRDHGRPAGAAVGRRRPWWPRRASTPSSSTAGWTTSSRPTTPPCRPCTRWSWPARPRLAGDDVLRFVRSSSASLPGAGARRPDASCSACRSSRPTA